jgi:hypothetical protein
MNWEIFEDDTYRGFGFLLNLSPNRPQNFHSKPSYCQSFDIRLGTKKKKEKMIWYLDGFGFSLAF